MSPIQMEWIQNVYYKYCDRLRFFNSFTLVPSLDGQHQIRYHKTALKTPISIDDLYSKFKRSNDVCRFVSDAEKTWRIFVLLIDPHIS